MPSALHDPLPHLGDDIVPVSQRSLIHTLRFWTRNTAFTPASRARLDLAPFAFERFCRLFRILDPFRKRHDLAACCVRSLDDADGAELKRFGIGVPREGYKGGGGAVGIECFDQRVRGQSGPLDRSEDGNIMCNSYGYCIRRFAWY